MWLNLPKVTQLRSGRTGTQTKGWLSRTHSLNSIYIIIATEYSVLTVCLEQHLIYPHNSEAIIVTISILQVGKQKLRGD